MEKSQQEEKEKKAILRQNFPGKSLGFSLNQNFMGQHSNEIQKISLLIYTQNPSNLQAYPCKTPKFEICFLSFQNFIIPQILNNIFLFFYYCIKRFSINQ